MALEKEIENKDVHKSKENKYFIKKPMIISIIILIMCYSISIIWSKLNKNTSSIQLNNHQTKNKKKMI